MRVYRCRVRKPLTRKTRARIWVVVTMFLIGALLVPSIRFLRRLTIEMALSNVSDVITYAVNDTVGRRLEEENFGYDDFVSLEQNESGEVTALTTNMARVNALSSAVLKDVVTATERGQLDVQVPLGNLLGSTFLLGRGPLINVRIVPLTSSHIELRNELTAAGINQARHQIILEVDVDVSVLIPWNTASTQVSCPVLIAETVIVGSVPQTYFNYETGKQTNED